MSTARDTADACPPIDLPTLEEVGSARYRRLIQLYQLVRRSQRPRRENTVRAVSYRLGVADSLVSRWECLDRRASLWLACCWAEAIGARLTLVPLPKPKPPCPDQLALPF